MRRPRDPRPLLLSGLCAVVLVGGLAFYYRPPNCALEVWSSQEKSVLLTSLAAQFDATDAGKVCPVSVDEVASGTAEQALATDWRKLGRPRPDVWTPAASTWVELLATVRPELSESAFSSIAHSPLVIGMPLQMATALGWPDSELAWADVLALEAEPEAWAARGHPEWGAFKLGQTDPTVSTSGLHAFIGIFSAAVEARDGSNLPAPVSATDVLDPKVIAFVRGVESRVTHFTDTVTTFEQHLQNAGDLSYISAIAMEEQEVWTYNAGKPKVPFAAVYPREGTLFADHPYVPLREPWTDSLKQAAAARFLEFLRGSAAQRTFQEHGFRDGSAPYAVPDDAIINRRNGLLATQPALTLSQPPPSVLEKIVQTWPSVH